MSLTTSAGTATVEQACHLFGVSRAAYYAAKKPPSLRVIEGGRSATYEPSSATGDELISSTTAGPTTPISSTTSEPPLSLAQPERAAVDDIKDAIKDIVKDHPAWGVRKVWATLRRPPYKHKIGQRRVWALMKSMGLCLPAERPERPSERRGRVAVEFPNRRIATDLTTVHTKEDGVVAVVPVIDCGCRSGLALVVTKAQTAPAVLGPVREALVAAFGSPEGVPDGVELLTDHGTQYTADDCAELCKEWHLEHLFAPVGRPTGNSVAERFIRTIKEECIWLRDWNSAAELQEHLTAWLRVYNEDRPHQSLKWQTPSERRAARLRLMKPAA